jgi:uncharacterized coiled-coil DUF342 family protein
MRRDEVHELFERVEKQLRESEDDARLKSAEAVKLQKEYRGVVARMKPLKAERDRITERARRLGISFKDYGDSEGEIYISNRQVKPSKARKQFSTLKDEWRIARLGSTPDDIAQQQRVLRQVAALSK